MKKEINIEKKFFPNAGKLVKSKEGELSTEIIDAELDPIQCKFNNDDCVEINTKNLSYITLSSRNLEDLLYLIQEAEARYAKD